MLNLQFAICSSLQNVEKSIVCLQKLISLHPFNPWNWARLAEAYLNLGPALSAPATSPHKQNSFTSSDKVVKSSFSHAGRDCLLCPPETLPVCSVGAGGGDKQNEQAPADVRSPADRRTERAPADVQTPAAEQREAALLGARAKACASLIRTR